MVISKAILFSKKAIKRSTAIATQIVFQNVRKKHFSYFVIINIRRALFFKDFLGILFMHLLTFPNE